MKQGASDRGPAARPWAGQRYCCTLLIACCLLVFTGCDGPQSALAPASESARDLAQLFWWMTAGAILIWLFVFSIAVYASRPNRTTYRATSTRWLIIGGGAVFPTVVLALLLSYSLSLLSELRNPGPVDLRIAVSGEQWWWRVRYLPDDAEAVELANEVRLPAGQRVEFILSSPDVIHSFWIPSLGGKMDMIPGRITTLILEPEKPGTYRGACAEYCGTSHALMNFEVVVMPPEEFAEWLRTQAAPAQQVQGELAEAGKQAFIANGCGACHTVRGTEANGRLGPDLTHVGGRLTLGAGILPNETEDFLRWIGHTEAIKPDVNMPSFGMLPQEDLKAIAAYLSELQ